MSISYATTTIVLSPGGLNKSISKDCEQSWRAVVIFRISKARSVLSILVSVDKSVELVSYECYELWSNIVGKCYRMLWQCVLEIPGYARYSPHCLC
jgi:hypothetical protein